MFLIKPSFAENIKESTRYNNYAHVKTLFCYKKINICCTWGGIKRGWRDKEAGSSCLQEGYSNSFVV